MHVTSTPHKTIDPLPKKPLVSPPKERKNRLEIVWFWGIPPLGMILLWNCWDLHHPAWIPMLIYGMGHMIRVLRLMILLDNTPITSILRAHFFGSLMGLILPFKIGEFHRIGALAFISGIQRALTAVWIERMLDASLLLAILLYNPTHKTILLGVGSFLLLSTTTLVAIPVGLRSLSLAYASRPGKISLRVLQACAKIHFFLREIPLRAWQASPILILLTMLIWLCEAMTLAAIIGGIENNLLTFPLLASGSALENNLDPVTRVLRSIPLLDQNAQDYVCMMLYTIAIGMIVSTILWCKKS